MNIDHIRYFAEVAETQNISQAAKNLFVSQPALSHAMARMEKMMGVKLFVHGTNSIALTEAGKAFLPYAKEIIRNTDEGLNMVRRVESSERNILRIASSFGMIYELTGRYMAMNPALNIQISICDTDEAVSKLQDGEADIGMIAGHANSAQVEEMTLMESYFFAAVCKDNELSKKKNVTLKELAAEPVFCSGLRYAHEFVQKMFDDANVPTKVIQLDAHKVLFDAVRKNLGVVICMPMLDQHAFEMIHLKNDNFVFIPIIDGKARGQVNLITLRGRFFGHEINQCINAVTSDFHEMEKFTDDYAAARGVY